MALSFSKSKHVFKRKIQSFCLLSGTICRNHSENVSGRNFRKAPVMGSFVSIPRPPQARRPLINLPRTVEVRQDGLLQESRHLAVSAPRPPSPRPAARPTDLTGSEPASAHPCGGSGARGEGGPARPRAPPACGASLCRRRPVSSECARRSPGVDRF